MGRPGLEPDQLSEVVRELAPLAHGSKEYRRKRSELAVKFDRTDGGIEKAFLRARAA